MTALVPPTLLLATLALARQDRPPLPSGPEPAVPTRVAATTPGPVVTIVDSLLLQGSADDPRGGFTTFWGISTSGQILVTDISNNRVVVFDHDGRYLHTLGARGSGPGRV